MRLGGNQAKLRQILRDRFIPGSAAEGGCENANKMRATFQAHEL